MKYLIITITFLFSSLSYGQEKAKDSTIVNKSYIKTEYNTSIKGKEYPIYRYRTGEYFTILTNEKTGREYWQPLEKSETENPEEIDKTPNYNK